MTQRSFARVVSNVQICKDRLVIWRGSAALGLLLAGLCVWINFGAAVPARCCRDGAQLQTRGSRSSVLHSQGGKQQRAAAVCLHSKRRPAGSLAVGAISTYVPRYRLAQVPDSAKSVQRTRAAGPWMGRRDGHLGLRCRACSRRVSSEPLGILNRQQAGLRATYGCTFLGFLPCRKVFAWEGKASSLRDRPSSGRPSFACGWPLDQARSPESCQATCKTLRKPANVSRATVAAV